MPDQHLGTALVALLTARPRRLAIDTQLSGVGTLLLELPLAGDVRSKETATRNEAAAALRAPVLIQLGQIVYKADQRFDIHVAKPLGERSVEILENLAPA